MGELKIIENDLVPVYITSTGVKVVYGTELHEVLGVKSKYADWVKNRLNDCEAAEEKDFEAFSKNLENGGRTKEYIIKLDTAKEMAMLERNEKGKQVRRYFIAVEKKYQSMTSAPTDTSALSGLSPQLQLMINMELKQKEQDHKLSALQETTERQEAALQTIRDTLTNVPGDFRRWVIRSIGEIANSPSFDGTYNKYQKTWLESYSRLCSRTGCDLEELVQVAKDKATKTGATKTQIKNISKQSVIADDGVLREAYAAAIREMLIAYCAEVG